MTTPIFPALPRPLLFAHRGASALAPENTLEAFELAARLGADVLEMDVHMTSDGEIVVLHDATLERTTDGHGFVKTHSYRQLAQLDAGCEFITPHGARPFVGRGLVIPRLADVLRSFSGLAFNIEIKQREPGMVRAVLAVLDSIGPQQVLLTAGDDAIMRQLEAAQPGCALGMAQEQARQALRGAYTNRVPDALHGRALQIPPRYRGLPLATGFALRALHRVGIEVHLWTLNTPREARKYLNRGVDGVMSDDPGALTPLFATPRRAAPVVAARATVGD